MVNKHRKLERVSSHDSISSIATSFEEIVEDLAPGLYRRYFRVKLHPEHDWLWFDRVTIRDRGNCRFRRSPEGDAIREQDPYLVNVIHPNGK